MTECLRQEPVYGLVPVLSGAEAWNASAASRVALSADGSFTVKVAASAVGVVVGFSTATEGDDYATISHALSFSRGSVQVLELGERREPVLDAPEETFHIVRIGEQVFYCRGETPSGAFPGEVFYTSTKSLAGEVWVDAAFYATGDLILEAALTAGIAAQPPGAVAGGWALAGMARGLESDAPVTPYATGWVPLRVGIQARGSGEAPPLEPDVQSIMLYHAILGVARSVTSESLKTAVTGGWRLAGAASALSDEPTVAAVAGSFVVQGEARGTAAKEGAYFQIGLTFLGARPSGTFDVMAAERLSLGSALWSLTLVLALEQVLVDDALSSKGMIHPRSLERFAARDAVWFLARVLAATTAEFSSTAMRSSVTSPHARDWLEAVETVDSLLIAQAPSLEGWLLRDALWEMREFLATDSLDLTSLSATVRRLAQRLRERLQVEITVASEGVIYPHAIEQLSLDVALWSTAHLLAASGLDLASETTATTTALLVAAELLQAASGTGPTLTLAVQLAERLVAQEVIAYVAELSAEEVAALATTLTAAIQARFNAPETLALAERIQSSLVVLGVETLTLEERMTPSLVAWLRAAETLAFIGKLDLPEGTFSAWVMNADTTGVTRYTQFPFNSLLTCQGKTYGVAEDGLYELTGDTDDGEPIEAFLRTGDLSFGTINEKNLPRAYLTLLTSGRMVLKTISSVRGARTERIYELVEKDGNDEALRRVVLARGLKGITWAFELRNISGSDFDFAGAQVLPVILHRRG